LYAIFEHIIAFFNANRLTHLQRNSIYSHSEHFQMSRVVTW